MKYMFSNHIRTLAFLLAALPVLLLLVAGCGNDCDALPDSDTDSVKLRFTIVTRPSSGNGTGRTRAADIAGEQVGTAPENYLNLAGRDIRFLLFDSGQKLLRDFTPDADITLADEADNNYVTYTVRATIAEPYFANVATADTDFYIMVVANGRPHGLRPFVLVPGETTIQSIADEQLASFNQKTYIRDLETWGRFGWEPSQPGIADGEYIPMSGLQHFTLKQGVFDGNGPEGFIDLSPDGSKNINMLRAVAKIEVIDKIGITGNFVDTPNRIYVEKAELFGFCVTGTILPAYGQWSRNGVLETQQVDVPTMASPIDYVNPDNNINSTDLNKLVEFAEDKDSKEMRADGCPVFSGYVTEYSLDAINAIVSGEQIYPPYIRVTVYDPNISDNDPNGKSRFYRIELSSYNGGKPGASLPALLRNHIYRYVVTSVNSTAQTRSACPFADGTERALGITVEKSVWGD